jgi:hypothetical protein
MIQITFCKADRVVERAGIPAGLEVMNSAFQFLCPRLASGRPVFKNDLPFSGGNSMVCNNKLIVNLLFHLKKSIMMITKTRVLVLYG